MARAPASTRSSASGACEAAPTQAICSSSMTTAASVSTRCSGSTVVNSEILVISVLVTVSAPVMVGGRMGEGLVDSADDLCPAALSDPDDQIGQGCGNDQRED